VCEIVDASPDVDGNTNAASAVRSYLPGRRTHTYTHTYAYTYIYTNAHIHIYTHPLTHAHTHTRMIRART